VHIHINGKMMTVDTVPRMGVLRYKECSGGRAFKYDIFDILYELL
jgi:hypothetical protein